MKAVLSFLLLVMFLLLHQPQQTVAQPSKPQPWVERSNENAQVLLKIFAKYNPEGAGQMGVDGLDEQIIDVKPNVIERSGNEIKEAIKVLTEKLAQETDPAVKQDLEILIESAKDNIKGNELSLKYEIPYFDMAQLVFNGLRALLDEQVPAERRKAALVRLRKYAGLEQGYEPITKLAQDRTRERLAKPGLLGPVKGEVERGLANEQFYVDGIPDLFNQFQITGYEDAYQKLKSDFIAYREFVQNEVLPKTREDFRMPEEVYRFTLEQVGVDITPEALITMAHSSFDAIQKEMQTIAVQVAKQKGYASSDYRDVIKELKKDQLTGDAILTFYKERIRDIESIIRKERLVTLPDREMKIRIASPAEAASIPAPNMRPPRMIGNTGEMGEFVLPLNVPAPPGSDQKKTLKFDDFTYEAAAWTLTAHEGRPGHEMQFASMVEKGVSTTRILFAFNSTNVEGWGLYSEAIMKPYMPLEGQLISLGARLLRAARAYLDPELQLGKITKDEARNILLNDVVVSEAMANQEVDRYTFRSPGQATAYYYGYSKLMDLRSEVEKKMGSKFNAQQFHDFILAQGLLPPKLLKKTVMSEFVAAH